MSSDHDWPVEVWAKLAEERRKDPWNRVVDLVHQGKLSPERAKELARERGLDPFTRRPASGEHDPMAAMDWTLAMATAWIIWRTSQAVQECMEAHVEEVRFWALHHYRRAARRGVPRWIHVRGFELKTPDTPTPADVLIRIPTGKVLDSAAVVRPEQAERELREALRGGDLVARGGRQADAIERHRWIVLSPFTRARHGGPHDAVYGEDGEVQFGRVTVERDEVCDKWPASPVTIVRSGRPKGSGSFDVRDQPLVEEALNRVRAGEPQKLVLSDLAKRAVGSGSEESKATRLRKGMKAARERNPQG